MADVHDNTNNMRSSEHSACLYTSVQSGTEHEQVEDAESFPEDNEDHETRQDLQQFGIYRSLPVYGQPDFSTKEPQTAEEYIRRVRSSTLITPSSRTELDAWIVFSHGWSKDYGTLYAEYTLNP